MFLYMVSYSCFYYDKNILYQRNPSDFFLISIYIYIEREKGCLKIDATYLYENLSGIKSSFI